MGGLSSSAENGTVSSAFGASAAPQVRGREGSGGGGGDRRPKIGSAEGVEGAGGAGGKNSNGGGKGGGRRQEMAAVLMDFKKSVAPGAFDVFRSRARALKASEERRRREETVNK